MGKHRSPAYPAINLETAIEKSQALYNKDRRSRVPVSVATEHLGYNAGSGLGLREIAALRHFGLLEAAGRKEDRTVWLSDRALDIILAPSEGDAKRRKAIRDAALEPTVHSDVWEFCKGELPSDGTLTAYLVRDRDFNDAYVDNVIAEIRDTFSFAKLSSSDTIDDDLDGENGDVDDEVDHKSQPPVSVSRTSRRMERRKMQAGTKEDVFTLSVGDVVVQWPSAITEDDYQDLEDWWPIMLRKVKRCVGADIPSDESGE